MFQFQKASVASKLPASNWSCNLFRWFRWHGWKHFCVIKKKVHFFQTETLGAQRFSFLLQTSRLCAAAVPLPGPLQLHRRAKTLYETAQARHWQRTTTGHHRDMWMLRWMFLGCFFWVHRVHNRCFFWVHRVHNRCFLDVFSSFAFVLTV